MLTAIIFSCTEKKNAFSEDTMNTFANAVKNQERRTENNMKARKSTSNTVVDLFYNIGASRGKDIVPSFVAAYTYDKELAARVALWARDVRSGAGERQLFRDILTYLEQNDPELANKMLKKIPELGRFDDLFVFTTDPLKNEAYKLLVEHINKGNGLAAKWSPRKGQVARELREFMRLSPKQYRKKIVELTKVVESKMCANDWDNINFNHVPSQASRIYKHAFYRHTAKFAEYVKKLNNGDRSVKVNANAIYPHDVLKNVYDLEFLSKTEKDHIVAQWKALPDYVNAGSVLPLVDVSGSMTASVGRNTSVTCLDVAVSLGLYLADKNKGEFKNVFLTFSANPELLHLEGNVLQKVQQMVRSNWQMNTNLHAAFDRILSVAIDNNVPQNQMPKMLLIFSDMQFDQCVEHDDSALDMIARKYANAGYKMPNVVFWNLRSTDNVPVRSDSSGAALVSGFSPAILNSLLTADPSEFTPEGICMKTILSDRYSF